MPNALKQASLKENANDFAAQKLVEAVTGNNSIYGHMRELDGEEQLKFFGSLSGAYKDQLIYLVLQ